MSRAVNWLDPLKRFAREYILENTGLKILALFITAMLWLSVASRPVSEVTFNNVPIVFKLPETSDDVIASKPDTLTARVVLSGPRDVLDTLSLGDLAVIADMADVEPGVRVIPLQVDRARLPASIQERTIDPRNVRVTLERVAEREVPIKPRFEGEPPPEHVVRWEVSPSVVRIRGQASQVREIDEVSTETFSLTGKVGEFNEEVAIDIGTPNVNVSEGQPDRVQLRVSIEEVQKERTIVGVPVSLIGAQPRTRVEPRSVSVKVAGPRSLVESLVAADLEVTVEYSGTGEAAPVARLLHDADKVSVLAIEPDVVRVR